MRRVGRSKIFGRGRGHIRSDVAKRIPPTNTSGMIDAIKVAGSFAYITGISPAAADVYDIGSATYEWRSLYIGNAGGIYFGTSQDVFLYRGDANRLDLMSGDSFRIADGQLQFGADVVLSRPAANVLELAAGDRLELDEIRLDAANADVVLLRGAANRLDLSTGDSFRIINGELQFGSDVVLSRSAANKLALAAGDHLEVDEIYLDATNKDVRLYRSAANFLKIDDSFVCSGVYATSITGLRRDGVDDSYLMAYGGTDWLSARWILYGKNHATAAGFIYFQTPDAAKAANLSRLVISGAVDVGYVAIQSANFYVTAGIAKMDNIQEYTGAAGVTIEGCLLKDNDIAIDEIYLDIANKDIRLYRSAANKLALAAGDHLELDEIYLDTANKDIRLYRSAANKLALGAGDHLEVDEIYLDATNKDVRLYRSAADILKTEDEILISGALNPHLRIESGSDYATWRVNAGNQIEITSNIEWRYTGSVPYTIRLSGDNQLNLESTGGDVYIAAEKAVTGNIQLYAVAKVYIPSCPLEVDTINEYTVDQGVVIDSVLLKDTDIYVDEIYLDKTNADIRLYRSAANKLALAAGDHLELDEIYLDATNKDVRLYRSAANTLALNAGDIFAVDTINEITSGAGVTIDGLLLKDSKVGRTITQETLGVGATTFAVVGEAMEITGDGGGNTVATITGGLTGQILILFFVDALVVITDDGTHAANTVDLSAAFTSADDTVLTLIFDGTSWYEVSRSVN